MDQWIEIPATNPEDLNSIPKTITDGENHSCNNLLTSTNVSRQVPL